MSARAYAAISRSRSRNARASSADACASILISGSDGAAVIGPPLLELPLPLGPLFLGLDQSGPPPVACEKQIVPRPSGAGQRARRIGPRSRGERRVTASAPAKAQGHRRARPSGR